MADRTTARKLTLLFSSVALMGLGGCGGGGGGDAAAETASASDPSTVAAAVPAAPTPATPGPAATAPAPAPVDVVAAAEAQLASARSAAAESSAGAPPISTLTVLVPPPNGSAAPISPAPQPEQQGTATPAPAPAPVVAAPAPTQAPAPAPAPVVAAPAPAPAPAAEAPAPAPAPVAQAPAPAPAPAPVVAAPPPPAPAPAPAPVASGSAPMIGDCEMFPSNAIWNTRVDDLSRFPAHPQSNQWVDMAGRGVPFQADWGFHENQADYGSYFGMPINVVDGGSTDWPVVSFDFGPSGISGDRGWPYKSDCAVSDGGGYRVQNDCTAVQPSQMRFPFPLDHKIVNEDGQCNDPRSCGDRHVLVVEKGACRLWESFFSYKLNGNWYSLTTAAWDLRSLAMRPRDWPSGDAAGLPMAPLLVKVAEANSGEIRHALRVNFRDAAIAQAYEWPARHAAGGDNPGAMPFGALLRLKPDFQIPDHWTTQAKAIATAAKRYGMYVSDNGADFHVQGEPSAGWDVNTSLQLKAISMDNMEFVDLKWVTTHPRFSPESMAAGW